MYIARFDTGAETFAAAALGWSPRGPDRMPCAWNRFLIASDAPCSALRVAPSEPHLSSNVLILTSPTKTEKDLHLFVDRLLAADVPHGLVTCVNAADFDRLTAFPHTIQLRTGFDGYQAGAEGLDCKIRLCAVAAPFIQAGDAIYQVHWRPYPCTTENLRAGRKYLARLAAFNPFSDPVREVQRLLAERTLQRGMMTSEFMGFRTQDALRRCTSLLTEHFQDTFGRIGFPDPPLLVGDFSDTLTTGRHPTLDLPRPASVPAVGASLMSFDEVSMLIATLTAERDAEPLRPDVFISYSFDDVTHASAACARLEAAGTPCWIAPRNVTFTATPYPEAILKGLQEARALIVFVSPAVDQSIHVPREVHVALTRRIPIIPVALSHVTLRGQLGYLLSTEHIVKAYNRDFSTVLDEVQSRVRAALAPA